MAQNMILTGIERTFDPLEIIVSKTDAKGRITYANDMFYKMADYTADECLGQPHSMVRHPDMPRCIFKLLWDTVAKGHEIFTYVVNRSKNGDHYWVMAHVSPTMDDNTNTIVGYHSSRRVPSRAAIAKIVPLYAQLKAEEARHSDRKAGLEASAEMLNKILKDANLSYDQFVFSIINSD